MAMSIILSLGVLVSCVAAIASATSPSPAPSAEDCTAVGGRMLTCVDYITIGSTRADASTVCCKTVRDALEWKGNCMCEVLKQSDRMGIRLNVTRAIGLPNACGSFASLSDCDIPLLPGMAPVPLPSTNAPTPASRTEAPTPTPSTKALAPAPSTKAPSPAPSTKAPAPAPRIEAPSPTPSSRVPTPAPSTQAPTPAPNTKAPTPAPSTKAPTPAPVYPPVAAPPAPEMPTTAPTPSNDNMGPSGEDSPAQAPSGAPSFTTSTNLFMLLLTLYASSQAF